MDCNFRNCFKQVRVVPRHFHPKLPHLMAPKTPSGKSRSSGRLSERSATQADKHDANLITECVKMWPESLRHVKRTLEELGFINEGVVKVNPEKEVKEPKASPDKSDKEKKRFHMPEFVPTDPILEGFYSFSTSTADFLTYLCVELEPTACSVGQLYMNVKGQQRKLPRPILEQILEFITDLPAD